MKHTIKITLFLLSLFLLAQFIGLYVVNYYSPVKILNGEKINVSAPSLPYGFQTPDLNSTGEFNQALASILFAFIIAISLMLLLTKIKARFFLRLWFFLVVSLALGITLNAFVPDFAYKIWAISAFAIAFAFLKIYRRNFIIHNTTELLIYPGIAAVFVPIFNIYTIFVILIIISLYDMWAVWHSGIMQKMAKYQINHLNIFSGFFVPYLSENMKDKIAKMKPSEKERLKDKKIKVNVAILGGGDIVFPIIAAGVVLKTLGLMPALLVTLGATLGLSYLIFFSEKKKFYPAMPFITMGIFLGALVGYFI